MDDQSLPMGQVAIAAVRHNVDVPAGTIAKIKPTVVVTDFKTLEQMELEHIESALLLFENNKSKASQALGITVKTLYNKLHYYGIFEKYASAK